jgi:hypothetical protein
MVPSEPPPQVTGVEETLVMTTFCAFKNITDERMTRIVMTDFLIISIKTYPVNSYLILSYKPIPTIQFSPAIGCRKDNIYSGDYKIRRSTDRRTTKF